MAPPIPEHVKRYTANPTRPARYRPGKAVPGDEDSEEEEGEEYEESPKVIKPKNRSEARPKAPYRPTAQYHDEDEDDEDDEDGFVTEEEDELDGGVPVPKAASTIETHNTRSIPQSTLSRPTQPYAGPSSSDSSAAEDDGDSESEDESDEEGSSSEDDVPQRKFQRPTFIKKTARNASSSTAQPVDEQRDATSTPAVLSSHHTEEVAARRLAEAESLIKTTIERDTAARLAGKKSWDDDDDLPAEALVDDTDGIDPEAEHSAWRLREIHRLKRDREAMIAREKELEEVERRRNLTATEREAEDREFIVKQKEEKEESRGKPGFLSKYHHRGAFFMDDETSGRLAKRDLAGARFADEVADKSTLPEYMRIRDMTKLGKKGRTRYTDLKGQDTGRFGDDVKRWRGSGYENRGDRIMDSLNGVDERFLPDENKSRGPRASGANTSVVGERRIRRRSGSRSDDEKSRRRRRSYSSSMSTSRSPPRKSRRQRSPSPYSERDAKHVKR